MQCQTSLNLHSHSAVGSVRNVHKKIMSSPVSWMQHNENELKKAKTPLGGNDSGCCWWQVYIYILWIRVHVSFYVGESPRMIVIHDNVWWLFGEMIYSIHTIYGMWIRWDYCSEFNNAKITCHAAMPMIQWARTKRVIKLRRWSGSRSTTSSFGWSGQSGWTLCVDQSLLYLVCLHGICIAYLYSTYSTGCFFTLLLHVFMLVLACGWYCTRLNNHLCGFSSKLMSRFFLCCELFIFTNDYVYMTNIPIHVDFMNIQEW